MKNIEKIIVISVILGAFGFLFAGSPAFANSAPSWDQTPNQAVFTGETLKFTVSAFDWDGDGLTYSLVNPPSNSTFNQQTQIFSWTPQSYQTGTYTVTFRVFDGINSTDMDVVVVVNLGNNPPPIVNPPTVFPPPNYYQPSPNYYQPPLGPPIFINFNPPTTVKEGQIYTYTVQASGSGSNPITYRLITAPQGMTINPSFGIIVWLPNFDQAQSIPYVVTVGASNGPYEATRTYSIFVENAPVPSAVPGTPITPPPAPKTVVAPVTIVISDLKSEVSGNDVVVSWTTDIKTKGRVIYDTVSQADKSKDFTYAEATPDQTDDEADTAHSVKIENLNPGTYYFRAVAKTNGTTEISDEMSFVIEKNQGLGFLALISDLTAFLGDHWIFSVIFLVIVGFLVYRNFRRKTAEG